jgi:uncharacterized protein (TIGR03437 family)
MTAARVLLGALLTAFPVFCEDAVSPLAPLYSPASIINSASNLAGPFAPNTIVSLYGTGLSFSTRAATSADLLGGVMPNELAGVIVLVNHVRASLYFVSPTQVNLLIPNNSVAGPAEIQLFVDGRAGPAVTVALLPTNPAMFLLAPSIAIATRADGSLITPTDPAKAGDIVVLYATGLGGTLPVLAPGELPKTAVWLKDLDQFRVSLDGAAIAKADLLYAGLAPGFAGFYQINLRLPAWTPANPEVRIEAGLQISPPGVRIPVQP